MSSRPRRSVHAPTRLNGFESTSSAVAAPAPAPAPAVTAPPEVDSSDLSDVSDSSPQPTARPSTVDESARNPSANGSTSLRTATRRRTRLTPPSATVAHHQTPLELPPLPFPPAASTSSLAQDLFPEADSPAPDPVPSTSTSSLTPSTKPSKRKQPKIPSESPESQRSAATDNDNDDDEDDADFEPVASTSVSALPGLPALPLAANGKSKAARSSRQSEPSDALAQTHQEGPARKRPRKSAATTASGSGSNTPAVASSSAVSTPGGTRGGAGGAGGVAGIKARLLEKGPQTVKLGSNGTPQQTGLSAKESKAEVGTPKVKETASSFRLGNFLNKKTIAKKPAAPPPPPPSTSTTETKASKPVEPEIPREEKLRQMKQRREDEKRARLEAEQESIDLYEQVSWMNRYELGVRDRLNAHLQANIDRMEASGAAGEPEPPLPRMTQFGSCFSYWPRDPDEE